VHSRRMANIQDKTISDLPIVLQSMINSLLSTCGSVKSWNIYENSQDLVNITIRFDKSICIPNASGHVIEPVSYKRQSIRQVERNRSRANTYNNTRLDKHVSPAYHQTAKYHNLSPSKDHSQANNDNNINVPTMLSNNTVENVINSESDKNSCHDTSVIPWWSSSPTGYQSSNTFHSLSLEPILEGNSVDLPFAFVPEIASGHKFWDIVVESTQTCQPDTVDESCQTVDSNISAIRDSANIPCSYCDSIPAVIYKCSKTDCFCGINYCRPCKEVWSHCQHQEYWSYHPN